MNYFASQYEAILSQLQTIPNLKIAVPDVPNLGAIYRSGLPAQPTATQLDKATRLEQYSRLINQRIHSIADSKDVPVVELYGIPEFTAADFNADGSLNNNGHGKLGGELAKLLGPFPKVEVVVTTLADTVNASDGVLSLREAINLANSDYTDDVIRFQPGLSGTINLSTPLPPLNPGADIVGPGADKLTIQTVGPESYGIIGVLASEYFPASYSPFSWNSISGLTLTSSVTSGAGISNAGTLLLTDCVLTGMRASRGYGGAFYNTGFAEVRNCTFTNNSAVYGGGAIANSRTLHLDNCVVSGNTATGYAGDPSSTAGTRNGVGGGIYNVGDLTVDNSIISGNKVLAASTKLPGFGGGIGGIESLDRTHNIYINNSTISGNSSEGPGGGIQSIGPYVWNVRNCTIDSNQTVEAQGQTRAPGGGLYLQASSLNLENSTVAFNNARLGGGAYFVRAAVTLRGNTIAGNGAVASGGGFFNSDATVLPTLQNSIVALNTAASNPDVASTHYTDGGFNIIGGNPGLALDSNNLPLLAENGGATKTIALLKGSAAINGGDPDVAPSSNTDQRGEGFPRVRGRRLDIGAYELQNEVPVANDLKQVFEPGDTSRTLTLTATDLDGNPLTYFIITPPSHGTLGTLVGNRISYKPGTDYTGADSFTFKVNDGYFDSNIATVSVRSNSAPTLVSIVPAKADGSVVGSGKASAASEPLKLALTVSDVDGADKLRLAYLTFNTGLSNANGLALSYDFSVNKLYLRSSDGKTTLGGQAPGSTGTVENDYGILDFANSTVVKNGDMATVTFYVTPKTSFTGAKKLWGKIRDSGNLEVGFNQMATWTVNPPAPPVSHVQALSFSEIVKPEETSHRLSLKALNPDNMLLKYSIVDQPLHGTVSNPSGTMVVYTPGADFAAVGVDTFTYKVNDGYADSNIATVTIKYNSAPTLVDLVPGKADGSVVGSGNFSVAGEPLKLVLTVSDEDGADKLRAAYVTFNKGLSNAGGIVLSYDVPSNKLYLRSTDGKTTIGGQAPGSAGTVENDFGVLDFANSTVAKNGDELTVTFAVTPKASFTGARKLWGSVKDTGSLQTAFVPLASWTVNASATLRVRPAANTPSANGS